VSHIRDFVSLTVRLDKVSSGKI